MKLIEDFTQFTVYETASGKGVLFIKNQKRGNNSAIFNTPANATETALALMWGGQVNLTHRIKQPTAIIEEAVA